MSESATESSNPQVDDAGTIVERPRISVRRKWAFRVIAIALSLLPFVLLEGVLRLCGVGYDTRLVIQDPNGHDRFQFNRYADRAYYGVDDLSGPDPRPFSLPKPQGTYRIVVVGGSTVAGFPYPFELALPRQLEAILQSQFSNRKFEILNAGMTSIMSLSEVDIVRQAIEVQPDLIVIHSGHNEFYGPGGSASKFRSLGSWTQSITKVLRRQRTFQLLVSLFHKPTEKHLLAELPASVDIPLDGPLFVSTRERFRTNLSKMILLARGAKIPIVLSTVPSNLSDFAPLQPPGSEELLSKLGEVKKLISYKEYGPAVELLQDARRDEPNDPLLAYRLAQCLEKLHRTDEAIEMYVLAADLDGGRFRAATPFLDTVREIADSNRDGMYFCDVDSELKRRSKRPAPGSDYFLEHVHYNLEGTWQVANILAQFVATEVLGETWSPKAIERDKLLDVAPLDHLSGDSLTAIGYDAWPFNMSPIRDEEAKATKARMATTYQALDPGERRLFTNLSMDAMSNHLWHAMGDQWLVAGDSTRALQCFRRHIRRRPWESLGYSGAARALTALGKSDEANEMLNQATRLTP